ncbi:MAG TPA: response regulator transcription factor [Flavobacteriales bacterium]|nr:response regulator transcription factor [Flavobacteriales bacterium]
MENKIKILVVEDDPNLGTLLTEYLNAKGHQATLANNGQKGFELFFKNSYDFLVLDVMMPVKDGFTLAKEIRKVNQQIPILFLTAKSMKEDTLEGFRLGADDYMTKPFSMDELLARMNAILKRIKGKTDLSETPEIKLGKYTFNHLRQELIHDGQTQKLTTKENELLKLLSGNINEMVERNFALTTVWGDDSYFNGRSMDVYIAKLRKYLSSDEGIEIVNVHGRGFKLIVR